MGWGGGPALHSVWREGKRWLWRLRNTAVGVRAGLAGRGGGEGTQVASGIKITSGTAGRGWAEEGGGEAPGVWTNKVVLRGIAGDGAEERRRGSGSMMRAALSGAGRAEPKRSPTPIPILPLRAGGCGRGDNSPFPSPFGPGIRRGVRAGKGSSGSRSPTAAPRVRLPPARRGEGLRGCTSPPPLLAPLLPETTAEPGSNFSSAR